MAATIRDVALKAGTSVAAASHTLTGKSGGSIRVGDATRVRIQRAAHELGYVPHPIARSLATGKTHVLGLVLPYSNAFVDQNPFCTHVMHGVFQAAIGEHYNVMLFTAWGDDTPGSRRMLESSQRVDGVILVLPDPNSRIVADCQKRRIPCVAVVSPPIDGLMTVNADDFSGGYIGTRRLIELGHRKIAFLLGSDEVSTSRPRFEGYLQALRESGIRPDPRYQVASGMDSRLGYKSMTGLLELAPGERPSAVFAINDLCASGAMLAIQDAGLRVPDDIAVVGYDDTEFCESTRPMLTSVRMSIDELGLTAVRRLVDTIEGRPVGMADTVLPVTLTIRQSCGGESRRRTSNGSASARRLEIIQEQ